MTTRIRFTWACVLSILSLTHSGFGAPQDADSDGRHKLQALLTQRRDILQERLSFLEQMSANGTTELQQVVAAPTAVLDAELQLASTRQERLELCRKRVEYLKDLEKIATQQQKIGIRPVDVMLLATAERLQAEIECLREQSEWQPTDQPDRQGTVLGLTADVQTASPAEDSQIRRATELRQTIADLVAAVARAEAVIKHNPQHDDIDRITQGLETARRNLSIHRDELNTRIRLLELDVRDAEHTQESAHAALQRLQELVKSRAASDSDLEIARRNAELNESRILRAGTILGLYRRVDSAADIQR